MLRVDKMTCLEDNEVILDVNLAVFTCELISDFSLFFLLKKSYSPTVTQACFAHINVTMKILLIYISMIWFLKQKNIIYHNEDE